MPKPEEKAVIARRLSARFDEPEVIVIMRDKHGLITSSVHGVGLGELTEMLASALTSVGHQAAKLLPRFVAETPEYLQEVK